MRTKETASKAIAVILISAALYAGTSLFPNAVAAETIAVQTSQLLPITGNACPQLGVSGFTPYIYENALHSFSFSISDDSYVAISGTVGEYAVPFYQTTRWRDPSGSLRIHVDVPTTRISGTLTMSVTLLSSRGLGQPTCISVVTMSIGQADVPPSAGVPGGTVPPPTSGGTATPRPSTPPIERLPTTGSGSQATTTATTTTGTTSTPSAVASIQDRLLEQCAAGGAFRLWIVLLVVYALIILTAVFGKLPPPQRYSQGQRAATILVPLVLLLGFWYFVETCRATIWMPITALGLAILGLLGVYRDDSRLTSYTSRLPLSDSKPKAETPAKKESVIITPPPQQKSPEKPKI